MMNMRIKYLNNAHIVPSDKDVFSESRSLGVSEITFKVVPENESGILVVENIFHERGGPAKHLHHEQEEWFYALEGDFLLEIGDESFNLKPGDSIIAPKNIPHVWAFLGIQDRGRLLITFMPAGKMEAFFREVTKANAMPPMDPKVWRSHGMELLGPPLKLD
jgi:quercetin dioxygenase-like cupin family protein